MQIAKILNKLSLYFSRDNRGHLIFRDSFKINHLAGDPNPLLGQTPEGGFIRTSCRASANQYGLFPWFG